MTTYKYLTVHLNNKLDWSNILRLCIGRANSSSFAAETEVFGSVDGC